MSGSSAEKLFMEQVLNEIRGRNFSPQRFFREKCVKEIDAQRKR